MKLSEFPKDCTLSSCRDVIETLFSGRTVSVYDVDLEQYVIQNIQLDECFEVAGRMKLLEIDITTDNIVFAVR